MNISHNVIAAIHILVLIAVAIVLDMTFIQLCAVTVLGGMFSIWYAEQFHQYKLSKGE